LTASVNLKALLSKEHLEETRTVTATVTPEPEGCQRAARVPDKHF
jgi:hypothetical protein